jgi:hypothetical protein
MVVLLIGTLGSGRKLSDLLANLKSTRNMEAGDVLRLLEVTLAGGLVQNTGTRRPL